MAGKAILLFHLFLIPAIIYYVLDQILARRFNMEDSEKPLTRKRAVYIFCLFLPASYVDIYLPPQKFLKLLQISEE